MSGINTTNKLGRVTRGLKKYLVENGKIAYKFSFSNQSNSSIAYLVNRQNNQGVFEYIDFSINVEMLITAGLFNGDAGTNPATLQIVFDGVELKKVTASSATENLEISKLYHKALLSNGDIRIQSTGFSGATDRLSGSGIFIFDEGDIVNIRENFLTNLNVERFDP